MIKSGCQEMGFEGNEYPFLSEYLQKFELKKVGCFITWDWNYSGSFIGLSEEELLEIIEPKISKVLSYKGKGIDELWLLVVSGHRISQAMDLDLSNKLNNYKQLNVLLRDSGYNKVYLYQYMFDVIYEWPGWNKHGKENFLK